MSQIKFPSTMKNTVSVIVPIYNVAPYLRECLDSIVNQTYQNLQIILVDDGSTDGSGDIAKDFLQDCRFEFVSTKNGGLSRARNIGIERAKGGYIFFIDSDDIIHEHFIAEMVQIAQKTKVEFVCNNNLVRFDTENLLTNNHNLYYNILFTNRKNIILGGAVCRCMFAKSLLDRTCVKFLEGKKHEDEGFLYMILPFVSRFASCFSAPYYYRQRSDSIMGKCKTHRNYDYIDIFKAIYLFYKENKLLEKFDPPYRFVLDCAIRYENEKEYRKKSKEAIRELGITLPVVERIKGFLKFIKSRLRYYGVIK